MLSVYLFEITACLALWLHILMVPSQLWLSRLQSVVSILRWLAGDCHILQHCLSRQLNSIALQVSLECRPQELLEYLHGEAASSASLTAALQDQARTEEERLLQLACNALGAQQIIRVCSTNEHPSVSRPLQQLIHNAAAVKQQVDLSGAAGACCCYIKHFL